MRKVRVKHWQSPSEASGLRFTKADAEEAGVQQHLADETDIKSITSRILDGRPISEIVHAQTPPRFGDYTQANDYQSALNAICEYESWFEDQPSQFRDLFGQNPITLMEFVADSDNFDECVSLGLLEAVPSLEADPDLVAGAGDSGVNNAVPEGEKPDPSETVTGEK